MQRQNRPNLPARRRSAMLANSSRHCRINRITPCLFEKQVGGQKWLPKSRQATGLRRAAARLGRRALGDGYAIHREDIFKRCFPWTPTRKNPSRPARVSDQTQRQAIFQHQPASGAASVVVGQAMKPRNPSGAPLTRMQRLSNTQMRCGALLVR